MNPDRRSAQLAAVIGAVLACYAGSAAAIEFEFENGGKLNWNTTVSVGASWRAEQPSEQLFTRADGSLIGLYSSPLIPGMPVGPRDGLAGNHAAGDGNLNYAKNDRFSTPFKVITDIEYKKGRFGALLRAKYWYDQALNQENVLIGSQANNYNGVRPGLGPVPGFTICNGQTPPGAPCLPVSPPGQNLWPKGKLSDRGFEAEQQFENVLLLDAYVYGSFAVGNSDLQLRVGNQVLDAISMAEASRRSDAFRYTLAEKADDPQTKRVFQRLAKDEKAHLAFFESMELKTAGGMGATSLPECMSPRHSQYSSTFGS